MKEIIIDGKLYYQQEESDIDKLPKQKFDKCLLKFIEISDDEWNALTSSYDIKPPEDL